MGLNEKLIIEFDGLVLYTSSHYYGTTNGIDIADYVITPADLDDLLDKIGFFTKDKINKIECSLLFCIQTDLGNNVQPFES